MFAQYHQPPVNMLDNSMRSVDGSIVLQQPPGLGMVLLCIGSFRVSAKWASLLDLVFWGYGSEHALCIRLPAQAFGTVYWTQQH